MKKIAKHYVGYDLNRRRECHKTTSEKKLSCRL